MMEMEKSENLNTLKNKPSMTVFAGTNGAGKSELTNILKHQKPGLEVIDADAIARELNPKNPEKANMEAGRETIRRVNDCIENRRDFTIETTLGGGNALRQMQKAKQAGFHINLYYVGLESAELHIDRVAQRVSKGGHHIDEADIRRRYHTSLENLPKAMRLADHSYIFDNTEVYKIKLEVNQGLTRYQDPDLPKWVKGVVSDWESERMELLKDLETEKERLLKQISEVRQEMRDAESNLRPVIDKESLERQYIAYSVRYEELKPKNMMDKILQPNKQELKQVEETLADIKTKMDHLDQVIPENVHTIQQKVASLGNVLNGLVKALDQIGQRSMAIQYQMMSGRLQRNYSQIQNIVQDQSPSIER